MKFSAKPKEELIEIEDINGSPHSYTLRELTGTQRDRYLNVMSGKMKMVDGKVQGIKDFSGLQSDLLAFSLYDTQGQPVPRQFIEALPATVQTALFKMAQKMSGLGDETSTLEETKND